MTNFTGKRRTIHTSQLLHKKLRMRTRHSSYLCAGIFCAWVFVLAVPALSLSSGAFAQPPGTQQQSGQAQQVAPGPVNQKQALERARARFPGNVISINEVRQGERVRYRIRMDNEGNIFTVFVDKSTGAVSRE